MECRRCYLLLFCLEDDEDATQTPSPNVRTEPAPNPKKDKPKTTRENRVELEDEQEQKKRAQRQQLELEQQKLEQREKPELLEREQEQRQQRERDARVMESGYQKISKGKVAGKWTEAWSGGFKRQQRNPHILVSIGEAKKVEFTLTREGNAEDGLFLKAYKMPADNFTYLTAEEIKVPLAQGEGYVRGKNIRLEVDTHSMKRFMLVPMNQTPGLTNNFSIEALNVQFEALKGPKLHTLSGLWEKGCCSGFREIDNPQVFICLSTRSHISFDLEIIEKDSYCIHVLRSFEPGRRSYIFDESSCVTQSSYLRIESREGIKWLSHDAVLDAGSYVALISRKSVDVTCNFTLELRMPPGNRCNMLTNITSMPCRVDGAWTRNWSAGFDDCAAHHNPQIKARVDDNVSSVTFKLKRDGNSKDGLLLGIYKMSPDGFAYLTAEGKKKDDLVRESKYVVGRSLTMKVDTSSVKDLLLVPMNKTRGLLNSFCIEGHNVQFQMLKEPELHELEGRWERACCSGFAGIENPQVFISISAKCHISLELEVFQADGYCLHVLRSSDSERRKNVFDESSCLAKSPYDAHTFRSMEPSPLSANSRRDQLSLDAVLDAGSYIALISRTSVETTGRFKLELRMPPGNSFKMLPNVEPISAEVTAKDILRDYAKFSESYSPGTANVQKYEAKVFVEGGEKGRDLIEKICVECRRRGGKFKDESFAGEQALGTFKEKPTCVWKRIDKITDNPELVIGGIHAEDLEQGRIGDCWFISCLSSIAHRKPQIIEDAIEPKSVNEWGVYGVNLFYNGEPRMVVVDDLFPVGKGNRPVFVRSKEPNEIWPLILEKAFAKISGGYACMEGGHERCMGVGGVIELLLGAEDATREELKEIGDIWSRLLELHGDGRVITASYRGKEILGLVPDHAYSVLGLHQLSLSRNACLVHLRNPHGEKEWQGTWSDGSAEWTDRAQAEVPEYTDANDGSFFMDVKDFAEHFHSINHFGLFGDMPYAKVYHGTWDESSGGFRSKNNPLLEISSKHGGFPDGGSIWCEVAISHDLLKQDNGNGPGIWLGVCRLDNLQKIPSDLQTIVVAGPPEPNTLYMKRKRLNVRKVFQGEREGFKFFVVASCGQRNSPCKGKFHIIVHATFQFELKRLVE